MIKSLRWRLQLWHAAILAVAIALFGTAFYVQLQRSTFSEIDLELLGGARVLEGALRTLPPPMRDGERPMFPPPRFAEGRPGDGRPGDGRPSPDRANQRPGFQRPNPFGPNQPGLNQPRPDQLGPNPFGPNGQRPPLQPPRTPLHLPQFPQRGPRDTPAYFVVYDRVGEILQADPSDPETTWTQIDRPVEYRSRGRIREVLLRGPGDTLIIVGRDIHHLLERLDSWLIQLILTGLGVLSLGLIGGWWLSGKTIRPIQQISHTADQITAANLSERIATEGMDDEVRTLAGILNSMFGRLDQAFQQQSQFTADASHELRTPLAVLLSHCELALNRPRSADEYKQTLATCQKAGARMKTLVEDLLTLARADSGKLELEVTQVDLQSLVREAAAQLKPLAEEREVEVIVAQPVDKPMDAADSTSETTPAHTTPVLCMADSRRVAQVLMNLISNAIHYNRPGGKVTITTAVDPGHAIVVVQDTGYGIPAAAMGRLFDRFYRVDEARSRQSGGSGLGLAICKSIVDAHGGEILVDSQLDVGSRFTLRLPTITQQQADQNANC